MRLSRFATPTLLLAGVLASAFAPGCTPGDTRESNGPPPIAFTSEAQVEGASVSLRGRPDPLAPRRMVVDVVARGAADVHGAAFRVTWNPEALGFVEATSGAHWSKTALAMAKEGAPGQLAVAWAERGEAGIDATSETILGTLVFELKGQSGTSLAFTKERSQLVDKKGIQVATTWVAGSISPR